MSFYVKIQLKVKISLAENFEQSRKKIEKNFFSTKKSEIFSATRCCFLFFDTILGSYFINKIRYIIEPDGRIV